MHNVNKEQLSAIGVPIKSTNEKPIKATKSPPSNFYTSMTTDISTVSDENTTIIPLANINGRLHTTLHATIYMQIIQ